MFKQALQVSLMHTLFENHRSRDKRFSVVDRRYMQLRILSTGPVLPPKDLEDQVQSMQPPLGRQALGTNSLHSDPSSSRFTQ